MKVRQNDIQTVDKLAADYKLDEDMVEIIKMSLGILEIEED